MLYPRSKSDLAGDTTAVVSGESGEGEEGGDGGDGGGGGIIIMGGGSPFPSMYVVLLPPPLLTELE